MRYTEEERSKAVDYIVSFRKDLTRDFLHRHSLRTSGTKEQLRAEIQDALDRKDIRLADIVVFLDEVQPWTKQHIYLLKGPRLGAAQWRNSEYVSKLLARHDLGQIYNRHRTAVLPLSAKLVSVRHDADLLRVTAVARREGAYRDPHYDESRTLVDGSVVELRAYVHEVVRNVVALDWNLATNEAMLQITQLPSGVSYEEVRDDFWATIAPWLDINSFAYVDLRPGIRRLHELEESGDPEIVSVAIDYETEGGRRLAARGGANTPLLGETVTDEALRQVRQVSAGRIGNFYWQPNDGKPLSERVHVYIVADRGRINISMPQSEEVIRYVVGRVRYHTG